MGAILTLPFVLALGVGYLFGSIPFGLVLTRAAGLGDIRQIGSGNIGATNVLRTGYKRLAAATLLLDAMKGSAAVLVAKSGALGTLLGPALPFAAGLGAMVGHLFPIWLGFKGGKGVATYLGVLIGLYWPAALLFAATWLAVAYVTRYSSLAALTAVVASVLMLATTGEWRRAALFVLLGILLYIRHAENIGRLARGEETRIGEKR
jgi:glycerol-3-phosphate acyltransferase PlsY